MKQFPFPRSSRILKAADFARIKSSGKVFKTRKLIFNFAGASSSRIGVIITKKVGKAVFRNKVRRWVKHIYREGGVQYLMKSAELVLIPRTSDLSYEEIKKDFYYFAEWFNAHCDG